jgi:hypothetical protein
VCAGGFDQSRGDVGGGDLDERPVQVLEQSSIGVELAARREAPSATWTLTPWSLAPVSWARSAAWRMSHWSASAPPSPTTRTGAAPGGTVGWGCQVGFGRVGDGVVEPQLARFLQGGQFGEAQVVRQGGVGRSG